MILGPDGSNFPSEPYNGYLITYLYDDYVWDSSAGGWRTPVLGAKFLWHFIPDPSIPGPIVAMQGPDPDSNAEKRKKMTITGARAKVFIGGIEVGSFDNYSISYNTHDICDHSWKIYDSGWTRYDYCTKCDKKRHL